MKALVEVCRISLPRVTERACLQFVRAASFSRRIRGGKSIAPSQLLPYKALMPAGRGAQLYQQQSCVRSTVRVLLATRAQYDRKGAAAAAAAEQVRHKSPWEKGGRGSCKVQR